MKKPEEHRKWLASFRPGTGRIYLNRARHSHSQPDWWGMFRGPDNRIYRMGMWQGWSRRNPNLFLKVDEAGEEEQVEWDGVDRKGGYDGGRDEA